MVELSQTGPRILDQSCFESANRRRLSAPGLRTFLAIADQWKLTVEQRRLVLGSPSRATYYRWAKIARSQKQLTLPVDTLMRISYILGIYQSLEILCRNELDRTAWLRRKHLTGVFLQAPPLEWIASGWQEDLVVVRRFLGAALAGGLSEALNAARQRGEAIKKDLLADTKMLSTGAMAERLGVSEEVIQSRRQRHEILALEFATHSIRYPAWQITDDQRVVPGIARIFQVLGEDPFRVFRFLEQRHAALGGCRAIDVLRHGRVEAVVAAAGSMAIGAFD